MGFKQVRTPCCVVDCTVFLVRSGAIIHRAVRVIKSMVLFLPTQACIDAGYNNVRGQNLVEVVVVRHISHVSGQ